VGIEQRHNGVVDLGYWLAKPFWGRGLMTEAARAVLTAARAYERAAPIGTGHFADNAASRRVIEKLGFVRAAEGMLHSVARGADVPHVTYRLPAAATSRVTAPPAFARA
jgi:RimJ/RimL family protein N-acetyltransferase